MKKSDKVLAILFCLILLALIYCALVGWWATQALSDRRAMEAVTEGIAKILIPLPDKAK